MPALSGVSILQPEESAPPPFVEKQVDSPVETTWIQVKLVDQSDAAVPGEEYRIELADGSVRKGKLNAAGIARLDGIPKGDCKISFPRLDAESWEAA